MVHCSIVNGSLRITNAGHRAVRLTRKSRIVARFGESDVEMTPQVRRERWWYPTESFSVSVPGGAQSATVTVEHVGEGYDGRHEASSAQPRAETSVRIDSFTANEMLFTDLNAPATVLLSWRTTDARTVTLSALGVVPAQQSEQAMTIEETTTFVLTAYDPSLSQIVSASLTVRVEPPLTSRLVPKGTIALWRGRYDDPDFPDHWYPCDGSNGTPDLRDRFILGAGGEEPAGETGEGETHTHGVPAFEADIDTHDAGIHSHLFPSKWYPRNFDNSDSGYSSIDTDGDYSEWDRTQPDGSHKHPISVSIPPLTTGTNSASIRPPWYALLYIMKGD